jgi:hypothetical protein
MLTNILDNTLTLIVILCTLLGFILYIGLVLYLAINYQAYFFVVVGIGLMWLGYNVK